MHWIKLPEEELSNEQFNVIAQFAELPYLFLPDATKEQIIKIITAMASVLKKQSTSDDHAKLKLAIYCKVLSRVSHDALQFAARIATSTMQWMPTPAELLELVSKYENGEQIAHTRAKLIVKQRSQRIMEETLTKIASRVIDESELATLPRHWAAIAETKGYIVIMHDGSRVYRTKETVRLARSSHEAETARWKSELKDQNSRAQEHVF